MKIFSRVLSSAAVLAFAPALFAQVGAGWKSIAWTNPEQEPHEGNRKVHFQQGKPKDNRDWYNREQTLYAFERTGSDIAGTYQFIPATQTEIFRHYGSRAQSANRVEIRVEDNYGSGESRQIEAYVTFNDKLSVEQAFFQIWGFSPKRATLMQLRGHKGIIVGVGGGNPQELFDTGDMSGREFKLNVIHRQETRDGRVIADPGRVQVYIDGRLLIDMADHNISNHESKGVDGFDYFKYGCYGSVDADKGDAQVIWKNARYFRDGGFPGTTPQEIMFDPPSDIPIDGGDITPQAKATSGLDVSFRSDNPAVAAIVAGKIRPLAPGTATLWASQDGNEEFAPARVVARTITVAATGRPKRD
jgi:hypothetical protein